MGTCTLHVYTQWGKKNKHYQCSKNGQQGWRDGSVVKSTDSSSKGPEFNSQQPHGGSQPSIMRFGALFSQAGTHAGRTLHT